MKTLALTASDYFASLPDDRREALLLLRKLIKEIWTDIEENMDLGMPTYHRNGHALWAIANQKHFMALYVMPHDLLNAFKNDLLIYNTGRSCIRFKKLASETLDLFDRIIKYTGNQMDESTLLGNGDHRRRLRSK